MYCYVMLLCFYNIFIPILIVQMRFYQEEASFLFDMML